MFTKTLTGAVKDPEALVAMIVDVLFPAEFLDAPDPRSTDGKTRREATLIVSRSPVVHLRAEQRGW